MMEEKILDTHKAVMDNTTKFLNDSHSVFTATHEVDYDQEGKSLFVTYNYWICCLVCLLPFCRMNFAEIGTICWRSGLDINLKLLPMCMAFYNR